MRDEDAGGAGRADGLVQAGPVGVVGQDEPAFRPAPAAARRAARIQPEAKAAAAVGPKRLAQGVASAEGGAMTMAPGWVRDVTSAVTRDGCGQAVALLAQDRGGRLDRAVGQDRADGRVERRP